MKIALDSGGSYLEPDEGPRNTRYHMRIMRITPIAGTRTGNNIILECGHAVQAFGNLAHAGGVIFCTKCRDLEEDIEEEGSMAKATIIKAFVHDGRAYNIGDTFEGSPTEIELLIRQGYVDKKDAPKPPAPEQPIDTGTGKGTDVSDSSSGDAAVYRPPVHKK